MEARWVCKPLEEGDSGKSAVDTRWVLTWKMVEGFKTVKARMVVRGSQGSDLKEGVVDASGRASLCIQCSHSVL